MKIDAILQGKNVNTVNIADVLSHLNIGDVLRARIIEVASNEILLKLMDGSMVKALAAAQIDAEPGDYMNFAVISKSDRQLMLETIKNPGKLQNSAADMHKQLEKLGIEPSPLNIEIATNLENNQFSLSSQVIRKIADLISRFKTLTPDRAVFLYTKGIKPDAENIDALNQIAEGRFKITSQIGEILKALDEIEDESILRNIAQRIQLTRQINDEQVPDFGLTFENYQRPGDDKGESVNFVKQVLDLAGKDRGNLSVFKEEIIKLLANNNIILENTENLNDILLKASLPDIVTEDVPEDIPENILNMVRYMKEHLPRIKPDNYFEDIKSTRNMYAGLSQMSDKLSESIRKQFEQVYIKLDRNPTIEDFDFKEIYKDVLSKLEAVKEAIQMSPHADKNNILMRVENAENNIRFMIELQHCTGYIQIPVRLPDRNSTAELYIMKRRSRKRKMSPHSVTMLIALNTSNLGYIESLLTLNGKNINLKIRTESQSIISFLKENYNKLYDNLLQKGYRLADIRYCLINEKTNVINFNDVVKKETGGGRPSLDLKI